MLNLSISHHQRTALHKKLHSGTALRGTDQEIKRIPASRHSARLPLRTGSSYFVKGVHFRWAWWTRGTLGSLLEPVGASARLCPLVCATPEPRRIAFRLQPGARWGQGPVQNAGAPHSCRPEKGECSYWWVPGSRCARTRHWSDDRRCPRCPVCCHSPSETTDVLPLSEQTQTHNHSLEQTQSGNSKWSFCTYEDDEDESFPSMFYIIYIIKHNVDFCITVKCGVKMCLTDKKCIDKYSVCVCVHILPWEVCRGQHVCTWWLLGSAVFWFSSPASCLRTYHCPSLCIWCNCSLRNSKMSGLPAHV